MNKPSLLDVLKGFQEYAQNNSTANQLDRLFGVNPKNSQYNSDTTTALTADSIGSVVPWRGSLSPYNVLPFANQTTVVRSNASSMKLIDRLALYIASYGQKGILEAEKFYTELFTKNVSGNTGSNQFAVITDAERKNWELKEANKIAEAVKKSFAK